MNMVLHQEIDETGSGKRGRQGAANKRDVLALCLLAGETLIDVCAHMEAAQENGDSVEDAAAEYLGLCAGRRPDLSAVWDAVAVVMAHCRR